MRAIVAIVLFYSSTVFAFPQMIRHGYTNCTSCHAASSGGGIMTEYGRALSKEVLSTWGYEGEEQWHYGLLKKEQVPKWLRVGGDFRVVQTHVNNERITAGRFIKMQEQLELAAKLGETWISVRAGSDTLKKSRPWYIPGYFISTQVTEKLNARIGRFVPRFGINTPEHVFSTRGPLNFGYQSERDTLELTYVGEQFDFSIAGVTGKFKDESEASAIYAQGNIFLGAKAKVGLSVEKMTKNNERLSIGLHGLFGFTEKFYLITDSVWQTRENPGSSATEGIYHFSKVGYEVEQGFHLLLLEDFKKIDLKVDNSSQTLVGLGFVFFPRPHFEFQGIWGKKQDLARGKEFGDSAWLLMHFYL